MFRSCIDGEAWQRVPAVCVLLLDLFAHLNGSTLGDGSDNASSVKVRLIVTKNFVRVNAVTPHIVIAVDVIEATKAARTKAANVRANDSKQKEFARSEVDWRVVRVKRVRVGKRSSNVAWKYAYTVYFRHLPPRIVAHRSVTWNSIAIDSASKRPYSGRCAAHLHVTTSAPFDIRDIELPGVEKPIILVYKRWNPCATEGNGAERGRVRILTGWMVFHNRWKKPMTFLEQIRG